MTIRWSVRQRVSRVILVALVLVVHSGCSNDPPPHVTPLQVDDAQENELAVQEDKALENEDAQVQAAVLPNAPANGFDSANGFSKDVESDGLIDEEEIQDELEMGVLPDDYTPPTDRIAIRPVKERFVEWDPPSQATYSRADLVISGPNGEMIKRSFNSNEAIVVDETLADGLYTWETVISPEITDSVRQEMQAVRSQGDLAVENALLERLRAEGSLPQEDEATQNRQSGTFRVEAGVITPHYAVESKTDDK